MIQKYLLLRKFITINKLRVFENDVKGSIASSSITQNVAFVFENASSTNDVSTAYGVSNPSGLNSHCPQLDHEDLEQLDEFDLEEMDLKWQVAMISMRMKKFYKKTGRKLQFDAKGPVGFDKTKETLKALVTIDGDGVYWNIFRRRSRLCFDWHANSSDTEVTSCSKECKESYAKLKKLYDEQRAQLSDASIEIQAYTQGLKKVEAQLFLITGQLEAQKEKEDLKAKVEKWHNSSKNLGKLLNTQMSANDKFGLGYGDHRYDGILSYENEVLQSVFMNKESELVNQPLYDSSEPTVNEPKVVSQPKVWSDAPIIEEYASDSEDEHVSLPTEEQETPSFANQQVKTPRKTVKNKFTNTVLTRTGKIPVNTARASGTNNVSTARASGTNNVSTARHNFNSQAILTNAARKISNVKLIDNTAEGNAVSAVGRKMETAIKPSADSSPNRLGHMTGNKAYLAEYQDFNGGPVAFGGSKGYITGKGGWDFKNLNKLVKGNLVRGLPSKIFENDHTCIACQKGKQHKASCKAKSVSSISHSLQLLHMDLFGPTSVRSLNHKTYCLVITDDFSRYKYKPHNKTPYELETGTEDIIDAGDSEKEAEYAQDYFVIQYGLLILQQSRGQQHRMQANEKDANEQLKLLGRSLSQETEDCFY
ncbi:hypothetical protein Tco_1017589 [Tanacetum coccineum]|uniref:Uncharacterized protein n=1 Tax=Tanacetum coccineum TaxID=301880 RepID=A0ABQ5FT01_9ASTR